MDSLDRDRRTEVGKAPVKKDDLGLDHHVPGPLLLPSFKSVFGIYKRLKTRFWESEVEKVINGLQGHASTLMASLQPNLSISVESMPALKEEYREGLSEVIARMAETSPEHLEFSTFKEIRERADTCLHKVKIKMDEFFKKVRLAHSLKHPPPQNIGVFGMVKSTKTKDEQEMVQEGYPQSSGAEGRIEEGVGEQGIPKVQTLKRARTRNTLPATHLDPPRFANKRRPQVSKEIKKTLTEWVQSRLADPYPSTEEIALLAARTGLSRVQVTRWMANYRVRTLKLHRLSRRNIIEKQIRQTLAKSVTQNKWS